MSLQIVQYKGFTDHLEERRIPRAFILHGTGSGIGVNNDINYWMTDRNKAVATPLILGRDGTVTQLFDLEFSCYHTGINGCNTSVLGMEIDNWNYLDCKNNRYYSWTGLEIDPDNVIELPLWRGKKYFEKLTDKQKAILPEICRYIVDRFPNIEYFITSNWIADPKNFKGIATHSCIHKSKYDFHPLLPLW